MAAESKKKTDAALKDRVNEMIETKKQLESEAEETMMKQGDAKAVIQETRSKMRALEEPMALCSLHPKWKERGLPHEIDPAEMRLREQKWQLLHTTKELQKQRKMEKDILSELDDRMDRLKEDIQDKTAATAIDLHCLRQAKIMAGRLS